MGLHFHRYRVESALAPDAIREALANRLGVPVRVRATDHWMDVTARRIGGSASISFDAPNLSLEARVPANPVFLEQLGGALEDLGAVRLELGSGEERARPTPSPRRWRDQPWPVRARHGLLGRLAFTVAYMTAEVLVLLTMPIWLIGFGVVGLWKKARPA